MNQQPEVRPSGLVLPKGSGPVVAKKWRCKAQHVRTGKPFRISMTIEGDTRPLFTTASLCPVCFETFLNEKFRAREMV